MPFVSRATRIRRFFSCETYFESFFTGFGHASIEGNTQTNNPREHVQVLVELAIKENEKHQPADEHRQQAGINYFQGFPAVAIISCQNSQGRPTEPSECEESPDAEWDDKCQDSLMVIAANQCRFVNTTSNAASHSKGGQKGESAAISKD